ncbi:MAG: GGDEF domain-containing protein [Solirubrobacteraceae bacterium]
MPRAGANTHQAEMRGAGRARAAPLGVRIAMVSAVAALLAFAGRGGGFWLALPCVLLAASMPASSQGSFLSAGSVWLVAVAASYARGGAGTPALGLMIVVPFASLLVLQRVRRRLHRDRDAMARAAFSDPLTGLANRRMLMRMADYEVARHRRAGGSFVALMVDLDGFKQLNDRYGHAAGDDMLCEVAIALRARLRSQDTIARLGGDEFCVIAPQTANPTVLAAKVVEAVRAAAGGYARLSASVGVALYPLDAQDIQTLLAVADSRLLAAKRRLYADAAHRAA